MTKKRLWIGVGLLMLGLGGYFGYRWWNAPVRSVWMLMPSDALLVMESSALQDTVSQQTQLNGMTLRNTPIFQEGLRSLEQLIWSPLDTAQAVQFLQKKGVWYSLHPTSKDRLGFLFYIPIRTAEDRALLSRIQAPEADRFRVLYHPYEGERIYELLTVRNESLGSFAVVDDYLVGSPSTILVERAVRRRNQRLTPTPMQRAGVSLNRPGTQAGLYVRQSTLSALLAPGNKNADYQTQYLKAFLPNELVTQFRLSPSRGHLIGLSTASIATKSALANLFDRQTPQRIRCGNLIPNQTTTLFHFSLSDGPRFGRALTTFINAENDATIREGRRKLRPLLQNEENGFYRYVGNELALLRFDAPSTDRRLVLLIHSMDADRLFDRYQLAALLATGIEHVPPSRPFLRYRISAVNAPNLPAYLFGGLFRGFDQSWIAQVGSYLAIGNGEGVLQDFLQSVEQRSVWSESYRQRDLLSQTLRPSNFTAYTRFDRAGESATANWPVAWKNLLSQDETALANVENMIYQSTYGRERIYSTFILGRTSRRASEAVQNRTFLHRRLPLETPLINNPAVVGDVIGGSGSLWVLDQSRRFMLLTPDGQKHPLGNVDGPIQSALVPVEFLENGRLQYAFTTARSLYIADPVNGLAKLKAIPLPDGVDPTVLVAPRRDPDRSLLLLLAHRDGSVWAYDRQQNRLVRHFRTKIAGEGILPFQATVRNQALSVVSTQKEGQLYLWNEAGELATGFPVNLKAELIGPAWIDAGTLTTMSRDGELIRLGEDGIIQERTQLYRPIRRGSFRLLPEMAQNGYVLLRTSDTEAAVLDRQGKKLFEVRGLQPGQTTIRYHVLGSGVALISIKSGTFTTLYDLKGQPVGDRPIPSQFPVEVQFSPIRNKVFVYSTADKAVQIWSIKLR